MYILTQEQVNDIIFDVDTTDVSKMVREIYRLGFMAGAKDSVTPCYDGDGNNSYLEYENTSCSYLKGIN